jgi:hypothetical protein
MACLAAKEDKASAPSTKRISGLRCGGAPSHAGSPDGPAARDVHFVSGPMAQPIPFIVAELGADNP